MRTGRSASVLAILSTLILSSVCFAASPDRITGPIIATETVRLAAGVPLQARSQFDQGAVDPSFKLTHITLLTVPSTAQQKALSRLLAQQQDPHSAYYHKWLTPEQYADRFGLSQNDVRKLATWLQAQGFTVVSVARGRNWIVFTGTAAQVEKAFQTRIHSFSVDGETHFANTTPPVIPSALSGIVTGFRGLSNFGPKSYAHRSKPGYTFPVTGGTLHYIAPGDVATMYDINTLYNAGFDGSGQKLAVMGQTDVYLNDLTYFRSGFGLSTAGYTACTTNANNVITACNTSNFQYVYIDTIADPGTPNTIGDDLPEADIDLEWSSGTARNAQIIYVNAPDPNGGGVWDSWYYAVDNTVAPVITLSYGLCELAEAQDSGTGEFTFLSDEAELQQANSEGITFMNSSADQGAASCDYRAYTAVNGYAVSYPASSPEVTGVGGTLIPYTEYTSTYWNTTNGTDGGSAKMYIPEQGWNDAQEWSIYCTNNSTASVCVNNPGLNDWLTAQESYVGIWAGGGGVSNCTSINTTTGACQGGFAQPTWQSGISASAINPAGAGVISTPARYSPDVSLLSSIYWPGYLLCTAADELGGTGSTSSCSPGGAQGIINDQTNYGFSWGGTSVAAPIFAGIVTLLNQYAVTNGIQSTAGLGNINPLLYQIAATPSNGAFNPVITTSTGAYSDGSYCTAGTPSGQPAALRCPSTGTNAGFLGFNAYDSDATTNYNLATGLGSVDTNKLFQAYANVFADFSLTCTVCSTLTVSAGETTPASYQFTLAPVGTAPDFGLGVTFACSFSPVDPTLTNSSCTFNPTSIAAGTPGTPPPNVTMSITTAGPNSISSAKPRQRTENRAPRSPWLPFSLPIAGVLLAGFAGRKVSRYSVIASLCLALMMAALLIACGGSSTPPISVTNVTSSPTSLYPNYSGPPAWPSQTSNLSVTVANDSQNKGVTWTAGLGTIVSTGLTTATYTAPTIVAGLPASDTITATSVADTTKSAHGSVVLTRATVPNTYTVTITATEGSHVHTQTVALVVQ